MSTSGRKASHAPDGATTVAPPVVMAWVNQPPTANPDTATVASQAGLWLNLTGNDTDPNPGVQLAVVSLGLSGTKGIVTLNPAATNGAYYYSGTAFETLSAGESATDSFTYTISDGHGGASTTTVTVTVTGVNKPPVARNDTAATDAAHAVQINVLANDTDVNADDVLRVTSLNLSGTQGKALIGANGMVGYTPGGTLTYLAAGQHATDSFGYTISDGHGGTSTARATVTVTGTWQPPVATGDKATTDAAHPVTLNVLANDSDQNPGVTLAIASIDTTGTNGSVTINPDGTLTYTPGAAFQGLVSGTATSDRFKYTISDGHGYTSTASVSVTVTAPGAAANAPHAVYVATNGNDAWSGLLARPNAAGTDGPKATPQAAEAVMRNSAATKTAYIEGGNYYLTQSLNLGSGDAGESWLAYPGQTPVIHGGQLVTGWTQGSNGAWTAQAPAGAFPQGGAVGDLFVNGGREIHARYPDYAPANPIQGGWLLAAPSVPGQDTSMSFQFNPGDVPQFSSTAGLYVDVYQQNGWQNYVLPVSSIDYATDTITLAGSTSFPLGQGSRYFLFNASSLLNATNEWYYDPAHNTITLRAPDGFTGAGTDVGTLGKIINVYNTSNITIAGLALTDTTSTGSGIGVANATQIDIAGNNIRDVGVGISLSGTSQNDMVEGNQIAATDGSGVQIFQGTSNISALGNYIHDIGQLNSGYGIYFSGSSHDTFANNLIENIAKVGIGGGVSSGGVGSYDNMISYNEIVNANLTTSDAGAIYINGAGQQGLTGDVVDFNKIHGTIAAGTVSSSGIPSMTFLPPSQLVSYAIYLDDYASGVAIKGNLVYDNVEGINIHSGSNNTVSGNFLVNNSEVALRNQVSNAVVSGVQPSTNNIFTGNLVSTPTPNTMASINMGDTSNAQWADNFYDGSQLGSKAFGALIAGTYHAQDLTGWRALGYDAGAIVGNPMFVDQAAGDYALAPGSAALAAGIVNLPTSLMGLAGFHATNPYDSTWGMPT